MRQGDTLTVGKLDRLGRSVKEVLAIADDLHARDVCVRILAGTLSGAYSPVGEGKFFFTMMAAFAELERDMIHERTMAGLAAARAQGRNGGRPIVMDADKLAAARARRKRGESPTRIATALGVSCASAYRHLAAGIQATNTPLPAGWPQVRGRAATGHLRDAGKPAPAGDPAGQGGAAERRRSPRSPPAATPSRGDCGGGRLRSLFLVI